MIDLRLHIAFLFLHLHRDWGGQSGMGWDGSLIYCMADGVGRDCFFFFLPSFLSFSFYTSCDVGEMGRAFFYRVGLRDGAHRSRYGV